MCRQPTPSQKAGSSSSSTSYGEHGIEKCHSSAVTSSSWLSCISSLLQTLLPTTHLGHLFPNNNNNTNNNKETAESTVAPTSIIYMSLVAGVYVGILPSYCFVNRGFTQWFHHVSIFYLLTKWQCLERFQVLSGISICLGWYSSILYEYIIYGRFCHPLYENMPSIMTRYMYLTRAEADGGEHGELEDGQGDDGDNVASTLLRSLNTAVTTTIVTRRELDFNSKTSLLLMIISHVLDFVAHPLLTYYFWKRCTERADSVKGIISSWKVIVSAYMFSRCWSLFHSYYNFGFRGISLFYVGHDVYIMNELDSWYPAYITESLVYGSVVVYKLISSTASNSSMTLHGFDDVKELTKTQTSTTNYETKPSLIYSESTVSTASISSTLISTVEQAQ